MSSVFNRTPSEEEHQQEKSLKCINVLVTLPARYVPQRPGKAGIKG